MAPTTTLTVTPAARFAALALKQSVSDTSNIAQAWRAASQWESFQHSYTAEQVAAGQAFILAAAACDRDQATTCADVIRCADAVLALGARQ